MIGQLRDGIYHQLERFQFINSVAAKVKRELRDRRLRSLRSFNAWERSFYSQNGEDGILKEIFLRIGHTNRFFVEFGVGDGSECNTAMLAREYGWSGLMIEGGEDLYSRLSDNYGAIPRVKTKHAFISRENIIALFQEANVPAEFDLLSVDIDGNDYWVWERLATAYRPRVVVIEYNASIPPPKRWVMQYNAEHRWDLTTYFGASLESLAALGSRLGYALIGTESHGVNAIFVRSELLDGAGLAGLSPREAYHPPRYGTFGIRHRVGSGPSLEV